MIDGLRCSLSKNGDLHFVKAGDTYDPKVTGVGVSHWRNLPVRLRRYGHKVFDLWTQLNETMSPEEAAWVVRTSVVFLEYTIRTLIEFRVALDATWEQVDLSFGLPTGSSVKDAKSNFKAFVNFPVSALTHLGGSCVFPFRGRPRSYFRKWISSRFSVRKLRLAQTFSMVKKTAPPVPDSLVYDEKVSHSAAMQLPSRQPQWFVDEIGEECDLLTRRFRYSPSVFLRDFSLASCIESRRKDGGGYGEALRRFGTRETISAGSGAIVRGIGLAAPLAHQVLEEYDFPRYYHAYCESFEDPLLERECVALCEPLKVRKITLAHWFESPAFAPLQKQLISYFSKFDQVASGKELPVEFFTEFTKQKARVENLVHEKLFYISDDGDAATDSFSLALSHRSLKGCIPGNHRVAYDLESGFFGRVDINYNHKSPAGLDTFSVEQLNAQLMGSRLSFVKLTAVHLAVKRCFMRKVAGYYDIEPEELFKLIRINGDDGLVALPWRFIEDYKSFMSHLWSLNKLKTLVSPNYFNINSRMFYDCGGVAVEPPFVRWNLVEGVDRTGALGADPRVWNELAHRNGGDLSPNITQPFFRNWKLRLDSLCVGGNNYFLPLQAGGLGMVPVPSVSFVVTPQQWGAIKRLDALVSRRKPAPSFATRSVKLGSGECNLRDEFPLLRTKQIGMGSRGLYVRYGRSLLRAAVCATVKDPGKSALRTRRLKQSPGCKPFDYSHLWFLEEGPVGLSVGDSFESLFEAGTGPSPPVLSQGLEHRVSPTVQPKYGLWLH
jgi:hypothetical protein